MSVFSLLCIRIMLSVFNNASGIKLSAEKVVDEIAGFMLEKPDSRYRIIIGTDSGFFTDDSADFVTAVVVYRVNNGGRYFWCRLTRPKFHTLRDRIIHEALTSIEIAKEILSAIKKQPDFAVADSKQIKWDFEIHVDIGENGQTKSMIQEVVAMVRANNFLVRTKPDSYAASKVADRYA